MIKYCIKFMCSFQSHTKKTTYTTFLMSLDQTQTIGTELYFHQGNLFRLNAQKLHADGLKKKTIMRRFRNETANITRFLYSSDLWLIFLLRARIALLHRVLINYSIINSILLYTHWVILSAISSYKTCSCMWLTASLHYKDVHIKLEIRPLESINPQ